MVIDGSQLVLVGGCLPVGGGQGACLFELSQPSLPSNIFTGITFVTHFLNYTILSYVDLFQLKTFFPLSEYSLSPLVVLVGLG